MDELSAYPASGGITVVIPAWNEAPRITPVIEAARMCPLVREVIVVDDGSDDPTKDVAWRAGARVYVIPHRGRGFALRVGAERAKTPVIVCLDADLTGLRPDHVALLAEPVTGDVQMAIGQIDHQRRATLPLQGGQRAVLRSIPADLPALDRSRMGADWLMYRAVQRDGGEIVLVRLEGVGHVPKWGKRGLVAGILADLAARVEELLAVVGLPGSPAAHAVPGFLGQGGGG